MGRVGASAANVSYISRAGAALDREGRCGFVSQGMPEEIAKAKTFDELRESAVSFAEVRERLETKGREAARGRTHYRAVVSFEMRMETERAAVLVAEWLKEAFPEARAMAFVHQNTEHTHAHVWIDARKPDGRKLHFSRQEYRRLDEAWNRIYSREMGREEAEHLTKKSSHEHQAPYERSEDSSPRGESREGTSFARAGRTAPGEREIEAACEADERAIRAANRLHRDAQELDGETRQKERETKHPEREAKPWSHERQHRDHEREG